jgi:hypothetical protein
LSSWGYSKRKKRAYPKGSTARAVVRGSSMSGIHRRRGQDKLPISEKNQVRLQAAEDLVTKGLTERNPAARTVKDSYDTLNDLEKLRSGENKSLLSKIRDR